MSSTAFDELSNFLENQMQMQHIYQPVMIRELLENKGSASISRIAKALLIEDRSQIEYYEAITKNMVGRVLTNSRNITSRDGDHYSLNDYADLTRAEVQKLVAICDRKIADYIDARGTAIWAHRRKSAGAVSGTLRYKIFKRAKFRCELCGVSANVRALEVDHIRPRNLGGIDDETNLQALCYSCNAMKRDRDDTDFRGTDELYGQREGSCIFCNIDTNRIVDQDELVFATRDKYPVTAMHTLIIPKRHVEDYFSLFQPELNAVNRMIQKCRKAIVQSDESVSGFNIGVNSGEDAGQTIPHCHVHLIPRRRSDVANPQGGIRGVIPSRQAYRD